MTEPKGGTTRREFLKDTGRIAAATSALAGVTIPSVHAAENNTIKVALIGCGGRGTGAAANAPRSRTDRSSSWRWPTSSRTSWIAHDQLKKEFSDSSKSNTMDVPEDRKFVGFDAYKKAMECLEPGDVAIMATPPAFRWVQFTEAIARKLNVFMEKPITVDGPSTQRMLAARRRLGQEEPQGGRRPDVPPLRCPGRVVQADQRRRDRRPADFSAPIARPARSARRSPRPSPTASAS